MRGEARRYTHREVNKGGEEYEQAYNASSLIQKIKAKFTEG